MVPYICISFREWPFILAGRVGKLGKVGNILGPRRGVLNFFSDTEGGLNIFSCFTSKHFYKCYKKTVFMKNK